MTIKKTFLAKTGLIALFMVMLSVSVMHASVTDAFIKLDKEKLPFEKELPASVKQFFEKRIAFPASAQSQNINETFEVIFMVNAKGELQILSIEGDNEKIKNYLFKKIEGFKPNSKEVAKFQIYSTKFTFRSA
jgi:hypothetical protein